MNTDGKQANSREYELGKVCEKCGGIMTYAYGENLVCNLCGNQGRTDFGKVRDFIEANGPQPAIIIHNETGVSLQYIDLLLREGRIEIPDGSASYIHCKKCGTDIRYGRYCPECAIAMSKELHGAINLAEMGERPTKKSNSSGKLRFISNRKDKDD